MNLLEALFLGLLQGLTEFLPVSSSGHLVIFQHLLGISAPGVTFEVLVHFGTLLSIVVVFWGDLAALFKGTFAGNREQQKFFLLLLAGTLATGILGIALNSFFKGLFQQPALVGFMLLITGFVVLFIARLSSSRQGKNVTEMSFTDGIITGLFQGAAIIPGISRSGLTIFGSLWRGIERQTAIKFSFLLSLPAIAGATLLEVVEMVRMDGIPMNLSSYLIAALMAFLSGVLAIKFFIRLLNEGKFHYFSYYCWLAGLFTIFYFLLTN